jgi:hypothetical protein
MKARTLARNRATVSTMGLRSWAMAAAIFAASAPARAQSADGTRAGGLTSSLSWVRLPGAEECVTARALAESVERRLHRPVFVSSARGELAIEGRVERSPRGWSATLSITRADGTVLGTRTLDRPDGSCHQLDAALELIILLAIDPNAALETSPAGPVTQTPPVATPPVTQPVAAPPTREVVRVVERPVVRVERVMVAPPTPWRWGFSLGGGMSAGTTPSVAAFVFGAAEAVVPRFVAIEISGGATISPEASAHEVGVRFQTMFAFGGVSLCPRALLASRVRLGGCVGVQLGPLRWSVSGATGQDARDYFLAAVAARATASIIVRAPFELQLDVAAAVPFVRPRFTVLRPNGAAAPTEVELFQVAPVDAQATLSAAVRFPP